MLARADIAAAFRDLDPSKAVYCVKHTERTSAGFARKMDGQLQTFYARKNWSSFMIFNCDHPTNKTLTLRDINRLPGRDLHRFCWLDDSLIGALDPTWNWIPGVSPPLDNPNIVHWSEGTPWHPGFENTAFADEGRAVLCAKT